MQDNFEELENLRNRLLNLQETFTSETGEVNYDDILKEMDIDLVQMEKDIVENTAKFELNYQVINSFAVEPKYNYDGDSGFDLHSIDEIEIPAFGRALVPTGLCFDIRDGFEIQVRTKSGLAINKGLMVLNSPGTVDSSYTGEIKVIVFNANNHFITINRGMKVAQAVVSPVVNGGWVNLNKVYEINKKDRGSNGFGSTGII
jgi:dUTP pyrophosphatase